MAAFLWGKLERVKLARGKGKEAVSFQPSAVSRPLGLVRSSVLLSDLSLVGGALVPNRIKHNPCKPFQITYLQTRETSLTSTNENIRR